MENIQVYEAMAKLSLPEDERALISKDLQVLTERFSLLESVDTNDIDPLVTVIDVKNVFREDKEQKLLSREELLSNAPEQYNGYFQVPKLLD